MTKKASAKHRKTRFINGHQGEHKLAFSFNADRTKWYYRTKSGVWRNISDVNIYGLRYILERLERKGRQSDEIYHVISEELGKRESEESVRRSA